MQGQQQLRRSHPLSYISNSGSRLPLSLSKRCLRHHSKHHRQQLRSPTATDPWAGLKAPLPILQIQEQVLEASLKPHIITGPYRCSYRPALDVRCALLHSRPAAPPPCPPSLLACDCCHSCMYRPLCMLIRMSVLIPVQEHMHVWGSSGWQGPCILSTAGCMLTQLSSPVLCLVPHEH